MTQLCGFLTLFIYPVFAAVVATDAPIDPNNPPQGLFIDEWAEVYMGGGKVGYMHSTIARGENRIHTATVTIMRIGRVQQNVRIETVQHTTETIAGIPLSFSFEMDAATMKTATKGTVKDGRVTIVSSQYGMQQTQTFDYPRDALMVWGTFRESLLRGFKPGTQYTIPTYAPELRQDGAINAITTVGNWETFEHMGRRLRGQKVEITLQSPMGLIETISWVDRTGRALKAQIPMPGLGSIVMIEVDQATALTDFVPPEIFMRTVIEVDRKLDPKSAHRIKYRIRKTQPDVDLSELPTTDMQTVGKRTEQSVELTVFRQSHKPVSAGHAPRISEHLAEYLDGNLMMNLDDPELVKLAKRAGGNETEPYALGDRLRRFVTGYVDTKSLNVGFATASEVCRTREGDCSEHSVLLAALGRLGGLPSRVVVGVAYVPAFGGRRNIFGYHMWTQFHIDGRWIDFDAALKESECSPARIAFATSSLKNVGLADLSLPLLSKIGGIDIEILEVEKSPRPPD